MTNTNRCRLCVDTAAARATDNLLALVLMLLLLLMLVLVRSCGSLCTTTLLLFGLTLHLRQDRVRPFRRTIFGARDDSPWRKLEVQIVFFWSKALLRRVPHGPDSLEP